MDDEILEAAKYHVLQIRTKVWDQLAPELRPQIATTLADIVAGVQKLGALADVLEAQGAALLGSGMGLMNLIRGYEGGRAAIAHAIKELLPELAPVAEALVE